MNANDHARFDGSIPALYDANLGPLYFEFYAADLANRVKVPAAGRVLEVACGTGIATQALREALPAAVEIVASDLNDDMLDFAKRKRGHLPAVRFQQANAEALPFDGSSFDALVCQFGLMFFPDKPRALAEALRILRPGGQLAFSVWDSWDYNPIARVTHETIARFFEKDPPTFFETPFGFHALDPIRALVLGAGFTDLSMHIVSTMAERPSAAEVALGLVEGSPVIHEIATRATARTDQIEAAVTEAFAAAFGDRPFRTPLQAIVVTARKPRTRSAD